jgi:hypothetical protein
MDKTTDTCTFPNRLTSGSFFQRFCPDPTVMYDLGELYAEYNARYFNGELPVPEAITYTDDNDEQRVRYPRLKWNGTFRRVYGKYYFKDRSIHLARRIADDPVQVKSTLLHEMLHQYLHQQDLDDGIEGHGPNFIKYAKEINEKCAEQGVEYRINFYDVEITREDPAFYCDLIGQEVACFKDLDLALRVKKVVEKAFNDSWTYYQ